MTPETWLFQWVTRGVSNYMSSRPKLRGFVKSTAVTLSELPGLPGAPLQHEYWELGTKQKSAIS
jgi:hypothetical protein